MSAALLDAFGLPGARCVHLVGAGGKTTLMYALAAAHVAAGLRAVTTATTKLGPPGPQDTPRLLVVPEPDGVVPAVRDALAALPHVTVVARVIGEKLVGIDRSAVDALAGARAADVVLVEADGSRRLPFKTHRDGEPVVAPRADLVIAVVGARALGTPVDAAHVHRADLLRERFSLPADARVTPELVARAFVHPEGWLARLPAAAAVRVFVSQAPAGAALEAGRAIARALVAADTAGRIERVVTGDVGEGAFEVLPR